jgi:hypothetical protein
MLPADAKPETKAATASNGIHTFVLIKLPFPSQITGVKAESVANPALICRVDPIPHTAIGSTGTQRCIAAALNP